MGAVVFDWDGTLVDTLPAILRANTEVLGDYGIAFDEARYRDAYVPDWREMYQRLGVPEISVEAAGARWLELYREAELPRLFEAVPAALGRLADAGFALGLVTAGHRELVAQQLEHVGLAETFAVRVCGDDDLPAKPNPEPLLLALESLVPGTAPAESTYVGDALGDMRMARAVGTHAVGIVSTLATEADLVAAGADEVYASVPAWVDAFLAAKLDEGRAASRP